MKTKVFFKAIAVHAKRLTAGKRLAKAYVSLFLVLLLLATSTFAWFVKQNTAHISTGDLEFQSASSLRINKDKYSANKITIPEVTLDEASSLDGRNIYFPLGESFTTETADMFFREGNMGDENVHYIYKNFELKGTSGNTPVYIKSYKIEVADDPNNVHDTDVNAVYEDELRVEYSNNKPDHQLRTPDNCPLRLAFIADSGVNPVVIDPSAQVVNYTDNSPGVVSLVDENGKPELLPSYPNYNWNSFSTYYYEHTPLFIIPGGQVLNVTLVVWLEGTLPDCDKYIGKKISIDIDIESNFAAMDTIKFVDGTYGDTDSSASARYWVSNDNPIFACSYEDPFSDETPKRWKTVIMRQTKQKVDGVSGGEWECEIPRKAVTNIAFYRLSPDNGSTQATINNAWYTSTNIMSMINPSINNADWLTNGNLQTTRTFHDSSTNTDDNALIYTAVHGNGYSTTSVESQRLSPCVGYWNFDPGTGSSSTGGGGQQSGGGGSSSNENCSLTVIARIPDGKSWVSGSDTLGFETDAGNSYYFTGSWTDNNKAIQLTASIPVGEKIVRFCKKNGGGSNYYPFSGGTQTFTVPDSSSWTVTYTMTSGDYWGHN